MYTLNILQYSVVNTFEHVWMYCSRYTLRHSMFFKSVYGSKCFQFWHLYIVDITLLIYVICTKDTQVSVGRS
jgi:hypothetical protein